MPEASSDYYLETYDASTAFIPYGAPTPDSAPVERLRGLYGVRPQGFYLIVARMEPENHVLEMVRGYAGVEGALPLLVVGGAPYASEYQRRVAVAAAADPRVRLLGSLWDQQVLDALYANCAAYLHGHSVGGTNPSLLRAMGAGTPVVAIDVAFNREVLGDASTCWVTGLPRWPHTVAGSAWRFGRHGRPWARAGASAL